MKFVLTLFVTWKVWTIVFLLFAFYFLPQRFDFLGGGLEHYFRVPWFWAWANFDGEHYLSIAQSGYGNGEHAFFPLYPLLMRFLVWPFRGDLYFLQFAGILISNVSFLIGLFGLWKLVRLDVKENLAKLIVALIIIFPTSFYFGGTYTEGLFFALATWSFYFARKGNWLLAGVLGAFASATKFVGIVLFPALIFEWLENKSKDKRTFIFLLIIPIGLFGYMYYLNQTVADPLAFFHSLTFFGEQRSNDLILLPQVFWRYLKIVVDIPKNDPLFLTVVVELSVAVLFLVASIKSFRKLRKSYSIFLALGYIIPTLSGSFSSLPRYVLVLFPAFILLALYIEKKSVFLKSVIILCSTILLVILLSMFAKGYWVA